VTGLPAGHAGPLFSRWATEIMTWNKKYTAGRCHDQQWCLIWRPMVSHIVIRGENEGATP
jgi:hypothetical protein